MARPSSPTTFRQIEGCATPTDSDQTSLLALLLGNSHQGCRAARGGGGRTSAKLNYLLLFESSWARHVDKLGDERKVYRRKAFINIDYIK